MRQHKCMTGKIFSLFCEVSESNPFTVCSTNLVIVYHLESNDAVKYFGCLLSLAAGGGAMEAHTTCNPRVASSSLACVTFVFFFWQGKLLVGCPYTRKGLTSRGVCLRRMRSAVCYHRFDPGIAYRVLRTDLWSMPLWPQDEISASECTYTSATYMMRVLYLD